MINLDFIDVKFEKQLLSLKNIEVYGINVMWQTFWEAKTWVLAIINYGSY